MVDFIVKYWMEAAFGLVVAILTGLYHKLSKQLNDEREKRKAADDGLRALLRDRIVQAYNEYFMEKKYCPIYAKENVDSMYDAYHKLGGNGTITRLKEKLDALPTELVQ